LNQRQEERAEVVGRWQDTTKFALLIC
jgi:hypothetical protein